MAPDEIEAGDEAEVVDVTVERDAGVTVRWSDGVEARFGLAELRSDCPCAACRGVREQGGSPWPPPGRPDLPLSIVDAELVGAWGMSLRWSDGHDTGIYPWVRLRAWFLSEHGR